MPYFSHLQPHFKTVWYFQHPLLSKATFSFYLHVLSSLKTSSSNRMLNPIPSPFFLLPFLQWIQHVYLSLHFLLCLLCIPNSLPLLFFCNSSKNLYPSRPWMDSQLFTVTWDDVFSEGIMFRLHVLRPNLTRTPKTPILSINNLSQPIPPLTSITDVFSNSFQTSSGPIGLTINYKQIFRCNKIKTATASEQKAVHYISTTAFCILRYYKLGYI